MNYRTHERIKAVSGVCWPGWNSKEAILELDEVNKDLKKLVKGVNVPPDNCFAPASEPDDTAAVCNFLTLKIVATAGDKKQLTLK